MSKTKSIEDILNKFDDFQEKQYRVGTSRALVTKQFIRKEIEELVESLQMEEKKPPEYNTMAGVDRDTARAESKVWGYNQAVQELNTKINKALGKEENER